MAINKYLRILLASALFAMTTVSASAATTIPGKIEAEAYVAMAGVQLETCSEGTQDVGWIDTGDWMAYAITVPTAGSYTIQYRVASPNSTAVISADYNAGANQLGTIAVPNTGGWQNWTTISQTVTLPAGSYNLGLFAQVGGFNVNWLNIVANGTTPVGPAGYTWCASENGSYTFSQTVDVAYGANGAFNYKSAVSGTITFNNATFGDPIVGVVKAGFYKPSGSSSSLIGLNSGAQMTCQFVNNTNGAYANSSIYALLIARNSAGKFCYLDKNGNMNLCVAGANASSYSVKLSDFSGFQFPTYLDSGRMYISYGSPLSIAINTDVNGNVGIAFPNIENPSDPNINIYFDWIEFAVLNNQIWCNTTQVDQFGLPMAMELFQGSASSYSSFGKVGITESRAAIMSEYNAAVPAAFQGLAGTYRILAPLHGSFGAGLANGNYFDSYVNSVWSQYTNSSLSLSIGAAVYTGKVGSDNRLAFTTPGNSTVYFVGKPTSQAVWGGLGQLATGNSVELQLEAQICAAFHRHVIDNPANLTNVSAYYGAAPTDYFSKFWHAHSINGRAYGFCYDDVNDQSSTLTCSSPRGIILTVGF